MRKISLAWLYLLTFYQFFLHATSIRISTSYAQIIVRLVLPYLFSLSLFVWYSSRNLHPSCFSLLYPPYVISEIIRLWTKILIFSSAPSFSFPSRSSLNFWSVPGLVFKFYLIILSPGTVSLYRVFCWVFSFLPWIQVMFYAPFSIR